MGKISSYAAMPSPADPDLLVAVDVDDLSMATSGTDKALSLSVLKQYILAGPSPKQLYQLATDGSIIVWPNSAFGISGDDAVNINAAFALCSQPASSASTRTAGPTTVRLANGLSYDIRSLITVPLSCYLDLNTSVLFGSSAITGNMIYLHGGAGAYRQQQFKAGGITNGTIDGTSCGNGARAISYGDAQDIELGASGRLRIEHFNGVGSVGLYEYSQFHFSEKMRVYADIYDCTQCILLDVNVGGGAGTSHEYNQYDLHFSCEPNQSGMKLINNSWFGRATVHIYGNFFFNNASPSGQTCLDISDASGVSFQNCILDIMIETTQTGSGSNYTAQTIKFGGPPAIGFIHDTTGQISFADSNWTNSDINTTGPFSFGGPVRGDTNLTTNQTKPNGWL